MSVDPGEGFRLLEEGEPIPLCYEYWYGGRWIKVCDSTSAGKPFHRDQYCPIRVVLEPVSNTGVEVHAGGPHIAIEVHREEVQRLESHVTELLGQLEDGYREAKEQQAEIERLKAELESIKQPQQKPSETPQSRQYWIHDESGDKAYFIGKCPNDIMVWQIEGDGIEHGNLDWSGWHHEPRCTGWDWQPDPEPEWFDLTPFGEHVLRVITDQGFSRSGVGWVDPYWPQGTTTVDIAKSWGWKRFRCLLKDAPPELVAMAQPAESPDDWVTQDRVPVRQNVDRVSWNGDDVETSIVPFDASVGKMHGYTNIFGQTLYVFCRRRDLPPLPQQPKTETVVFYECIVFNDEAQSNELRWFADPDRRHTKTGRTETREVVR